MRSLPTTPTTAHCRTFRADPVALSSPVGGDPERDLHDALNEDLAFAEQLLADLYAACREGGRGMEADHRRAHAKLGIVLDWMRDRLGHAAGAPCRFAIGSGHCIIEAEGAAS